MAEYKTYFGLTHDHPTDSKSLEEWKDKNCSRNVHMFDETYSIDEHYLVCDACDMMVYIDRISTEFVEPHVLKAIEENDRLERERQDIEDEQLMKELGIANDLADAEQPAIDYEKLMKELTIKNNQE